MQKMIRGVAIAATALLGIYVLLLVVSLFVQRPFADFFFGTPAEAYGLLPMFPVVPFLIGLLRLICVSLLLVCCGNKRGGIWLELVLLVVMAVVIPLCNYGANYIYNFIIAQYFGLSHTVARNVVATLTNLLAAPSNWGQVLAYVVCGMSIVFKWICKKQTVSPEENAC